MIRKLLVPLAATLLLGGCVTGYGYRAGAGDYYYGQPSTQYRYYGSYPYYGGVGGYPYYGGYGSYGYPYRYGYGYPTRPYYYRPGYPYHGHPYRPHYPRPPVTGTPNPDPNPDYRPPRDRDGSPWRNLDQLRRRQQADGGAIRPAPSGISGTAPRPVISSPPPRRDDSGLGQRIRQAQQAPRRRSVQEQEP